MTGGKAPVTEVSQEAVPTAAMELGVSSHTLAIANTWPSLHIHGLGLLSPPALTLLRRALLGQDSQGATTW